MGAWTAPSAASGCSAARLYLVTGTRPGGRSLAEVLAPALRGGVDIVQLRAKDAGDEEILAAAAEARPLCAAAGALLLVNDRPDLAVAAGADGVHVGQDDMAVAEARAITGPELLVGLSTHAPAEIDAAGRRLHRRRAGARDAHEAGAPRGRPRPRPLRGRARRAAVVRDRRRSTPPRSAAVVDAGATRIAVVRAITDADDPEAAAAALRAALPQEVAHGRP